MQLRIFAGSTRRLAVATAMAAVSVTALACNDDNDNGGTGPARRGCTTRGSGSAIRS